MTPLSLATDGFIGGPLALATNGYIVADVTESAIAIGGGAFISQREHDLEAQLRSDDDAAVLAVIAIAKAINSRIIM